jgi:hypothetical protein
MADTLETLRNDPQFVERWRQLLENDQVVKRAVECLLAKWREWLTTIPVNQQQHDAHILHGVAIGRAGCAADLESLAVLLQPDEPKIAEPVDLLEQAAKQLNRGDRDE